MPRVISKGALRPALGWTAAILGALVLNIFLFGLMPGLVQTIPDNPEKRDDPVTVNVIRVKKAEPPPRKKEPPKPPEPEKLQVQTRQTQIRSPKTDLKPRLPFELNVNLPAAPMDLAMPPLEHFSLDRPGLKSLYDISELDTGLMPLVKIPPLYPIRARRNGIEGSVTVEFTVTRDGLVSDISILAAKPETLFDNAVITCVSQWKFTPPKKEGVPVATRARTTVEFRLED